MLGPITKQTWEEFPIDVDFVDRLATGEILVAPIEVVATDRRDDSVITSTIVKASPAPSVSGTVATCWVQAGSDEVDYMLRFRVITSSARRLEEDVRLSVREQT